MPTRLTVWFCSMLWLGANAQAQPGGPDPAPAEEPSPPSALPPAATGTCRSLVPVYDPRRGPLPTRQEYREVDVPAKDAPAGSKCPAGAANGDPPK